MTAATPADGDGAGGGSSHPDVTEQKDHFRHRRNAAASAGGGRCVQLSPGSGQEERRNCLQQKPQGDRMKSYRDFPVGRPPWLHSSAPRCPWHRAGLV